MKATPDVYLGGRRMRLHPGSAIGKGGEADVYDIGGGRALKLFKPPDHPDLAQDPQAQQAARLRLEEHQEKLRRFPGGLPTQAVTPGELAFADPRSGRIVGYAMPLIRGPEALLRYADRSFRTSGGITGNDVAAIFRGMYPTIEALHRAGVVLGDFNDLNVLVQSDRTAWFVDLDSAQFGPYLCHAYTTRFVDPTLCDPRTALPRLDRPHNEGSDWYAFAVMLMQCLLYTDPYGGVYRPKDPARKVPPPARPLRRITVFHPEVGYPKPAIHYSMLPDEMLEQFHRVFEKDLRGVFPLVLLESLRWTVCRACGTEHARPACPICAGHTPAAVRTATVVRGTVTATRVFRTEGRLLAAAVHAGRLCYLWHEAGAFRREDGSVVMRGSLDPRLRFRLQERRTLAGREGRIAVLRSGQPPEWLTVDACGPLPAFDANAEHVYWAQGGQLWHDAPFGPACIGDVLAGQTRLWAGPAFGFGLYRAGGLTVAFVFDRERRGINDTVRLPSLSGSLVDAECVFSRDRCWLLLTTEESGRMVHHGVVVNNQGEVEAVARAGAGESPWLGPALRGACAAGSFLLAPTDEGVVRVEPVGGVPSVTRAFPDTEPFVHAAGRLLAAPEGVYFADDREITLLKIA